MRTKFLILFISIGYFVISQNLDKKIMGIWICDKIVDSSNNNIKGKYGYTGDYFELDFKSDKYSPIYSPFDRNREFVLDYYVYRKDSTLDLFPDARFKFPEQKYKIRYVDKTKLILETQNLNNETIFYHFSNQNKYLDQVKQPLMFDYDTIVIRHLKSNQDRYQSKKSNFINHESAYIIHNKKSLYLPTPTFDDWHTIFGHYISLKFNFPDSITPNFMSEEIIVDFDVAKNGAENIFLVKGIAPEFDNQIIKIMHDCKSKWKPVIIDKKYYPSRNRLHLIFYLGNVELP